VIVEILANEDGDHQTREGTQILVKHILEVLKHVMEQRNEEFQNYKG